jgi:hypothetical protein
LVLTCNSHTANLLAKDLISKPFIEKAKVILKVFHGPNAEKKLLNQGILRIKCFAILGGVHIGIRLKMY